MEIVFGWFMFSIIVGVGASTRGRNGGGWFLLALVISPLLAGLLVLALPKLEGRINPRTTRKCPFCAELIKPEATMCKHCRSELPALPALKPVPAF
jgi:hypothetical protein